MKRNIEESILKILKEDQRGNNPIPDPLRFSYLHSKKDSNAEEIIKMIADSEYVAKELYRIDVPKENFTIRPMARPEVRDWVIYQFITDEIMKNTIDKLSNRSYSVRNFKNKSSKINAWKQFDEDSSTLFKKGFVFCVTTDISGYFENINLIELRSKIYNHIPDDEKLKASIDLLFNKILYKWSAGRLKNFGLPQGPQASSYLGDLYLDNVDQSMEHIEGYIRYMDDIHIFCKTEIEAKISLIKLIKELRKYKLNINAKKTRILKQQEVMSLFDDNREILNIIQNIIDTRNKTKIKTIVPVLKNLFVNAFDKNNRFGDRHIKFALFRLSIIKNSGIDIDCSTIVNKIMEEFHNKPHLGQIFCEFLVQFPESKVREFFINYIKADDRIYEWQELHVLRGLLETANSFNEESLDLFVDRFKDRNNHWAIRSLYALLLGKYGNNTRREIVKDFFYEESNDELKKNLAISLQELGLASRNDFYNECQKEIWPEFFIKFLKDLKSVMYFWPYEKIKIENFTVEDMADKYE